MLATYVQLSPLVRPFLIFLKIWLKARELNNPGGKHGKGISLSSYSFVLMGIAYLQHINLVPNLQDAALIDESGMDREAFWARVKITNTSRPSRKHSIRGRGGYQAERTSREGNEGFRAMAVDTTFVRQLPVKSSWSPTWPSKEYNQRDSQKVRSRSPSPSRISQQAGGGWDDCEQHINGSRYSHASTSAVLEERGHLLVTLIEGFFTYYTNLPLQSKAVSIWRGQPIERQQVNNSRASDSDRKGSSRFPQVTSEESEDLYEGERHDEEDALTVALRDSWVRPLNSKEQALGDSLRSTSSLSNNPKEHVASNEDRMQIESDEAEREEADIAARLAALEASLRAGGITDLGPAFEQSLKLQREQSATIEKQPASKGEGEIGVQRRDFAQEDKHTTYDNHKPRMDLRASSPASRKVSSTNFNQNNRLFPFPAQEDPESFVEPLSWTQRLVVQDPFIHTRNTCLNIQPSMVRKIIEVGFLLVQHRWRASIELTRFQTAEYG